MIHKHTISFKHAFDGLKWALKTQPNYKIHFLFSLLALGGGVYFQISYFEFLIIGILITLGFAVETVNTSIEETCDAVDESIRPDIKIAKDTAAGAMLVVAIGAFVMACFIFIPYILRTF
jgi:diacylglycerol kinase